MGVNLKGRSFLKLEDYTPAEIEYLVDLINNKQCLILYDLPSIITLVKLKGVIQKTIHIRINIISSSLTT